MYFFLGIKINCFNVENGDIPATAPKRVHKKCKLCRKCGKYKDTMLYYVSGFMVHDTLFLRTLKHV